MHTYIRATYLRTYNDTIPILWVQMDVNFGANSHMWGVHPANYGASHWGGAMGHGAEYSNMRGELVT